MPAVDLLDAHVRGLSAADVDAARPLARRQGFRPTTADTLRFAIELAAALSRCSTDDGTITGLPEGFTWPKRSRHRPDAIDRLMKKRGARRADADPGSPATSTQVV